MKKLLLGAVFAALCFGDASAISLQTKSSKANVSNTLKMNMGQYYKGMVSLANALAHGWVDSLNRAENDADFADCKQSIKAAKNSLKTVAKFTQTLLDRKTDNAFIGTSLNTATNRANVALGTFNNAVASLKGSSYWKHCGAQLRFSILVITNALRSLSFPGTQFNIAGAGYSAANGLTGPNSNAQNNIANPSWQQAGQPSMGSKAYTVLNAAEQLVQNVGNATTASMGYGMTQGGTYNQQYTQQSNYAPQQYNTNYNSGYSNYNQGYSSPQPAPSRGSTRG